MNQLLAARIVRRIALVTSLALVGGGLTACAASTPASSVSSTATTFWDATVVHSISIEVADAEADAYTDVFDQESGDDDVAPLAAFLKFINESDDATFTAELGDYLDVDSFATYLAFQDLVDNFDDIAGPGNNSYLYYDEETGLMTVVSWDLNLAFGVQNGGGGGGGPQGGGKPPAGGMGGKGGGPSGGNVLSERFLADPTFSALYDTAKADLTASLFASGLAQSQLDEWTALITAQASDLVSADTIESEAASVESYLN